MPDGASIALSRRQVNEIKQIGRHDEAVRHAVSLIAEQLTALVESSAKPDVIVLALPVPLIEKLVNARSEDQAEMAEEEGDMLMEGLTNLSPRRLQKLLADCKSVKVKRLFFFFADRHTHAWRRHLKKEGIDLGSGKRMLVKGGKLDSTYFITVPKDLNGVQ